ncbi:hypothetical protein E4U42_005239 [Claviceps africana]|uniref:Acetylxylan esterase n=1 Tax=Claviceps africana TaxID=83212 RepID=A0A8K0J440_9HYPO|nr:hypothetical protein E4U42_005239 [Claviceps africana]
MKLLSNLGLLLFTLRGVRSHDSSCPDVHIIVARGTGVPPGYDLYLPLVNKLKLIYKGSTSESVDYPACGGGPLCGGLSYGDSARQGTAAVGKTVNDFNAKCPQTKIIMMGYSQGMHIMDNALCGGDDPNAHITNGAPTINSNAACMITAVVGMGNPRYQAGLSDDAGTCTGSGFDARPQGFKCAAANKIVQYCDEGDPYCCPSSITCPFGQMKSCDDSSNPCCLGLGNLVHGSYVIKYGEKALNFIESKTAA